MKSKLKVIALISGRGSNLKSLIQHAQHYEITAVLSNKSAAPGLNFAKQAKISCKAFDRSSFDTLKAQKAAILEEAIALKPDLVALAGFMLIIEPDFVSAFPGRIVNIHPSLLPKFPGLDTHKRALAAKESEHGCSVHIVDTGVDTGPLIAQAKLAINAGDTEESLAARVLPLEHAIYPWVINSIALGKLVLSPDGPRSNQEMQREALAAGYKICC